jgi:hypothetical protein
MLRLIDVIPFGQRKPTSGNGPVRFSTLDGVLDVRMHIRRHEEAFRFGVDARSLEVSKHR